MTHIWDDATDVDQTSLLVLLCLADYADDRGRSWPSVARIAERARCSERHATRVLGELEKSGWVVRTLNPGHSTTYTVVIRGDKMAPLIPESPSGDLGITTGGDTQIRYNPQVEPPKNRQGRARAKPVAIPADYQPSTKAREWALAHYPQVDWKLETKKMIEYFSMPGAVKRADWDKTWMNWLRRAAERTPATKASGGQPWW